MLFRSGRSGFPETGLIACFFRNGMIFVKSKTIPSGEHTGISKGTNEIAQHEKGSRLKSASLLFAFAPPKSLFHSDAVMYIRSVFLPISFLNCKIPQCYSTQMPSNT